MYNIQINTNGYWTGGAAAEGYGTYEGGVDIESIPDEPDIRRRQAYRLTDGVLVLDTVRLAEIDAEIAAEIPMQTDAERIAALEADNAELREALEALIGGTE